MLETTGMAVVIPTWSNERAVRLLARLTENEAADTQYVLVGDVPAAGRVLNAHYVPTDSLSAVEAMAKGARYAIENIPSHLIAFFHDDVELDELAWDSVVLDYFAANPHCGLLGFGGAFGFAHPDIYKLPYELNQLARYDFVSYMREAETHGRRVAKAARVAALDGFALICTREFYLQAGVRRIFQAPFLGSPDRARKLVNGDGAWAACLADGIPFHMYDAWLCCRAAELGYEVHMLPLAVHHAGGGTSVGQQARYEAVVRRLGYRDGQHLFDDAHRRIYDRFARVLPIELPRSV